MKAAEKKRSFERRDDTLPPPGRGPSYAPLPPPPPPPALARPRTFSAELMRLAGERRARVPTYGRVSVQGRFT